LFILCNPHNPVGRIYTQGELLHMAEICLRSGVVICSDEIHSDLVYSGFQHVPIASLDSDIAQKTITLMSPSKTFNLAGLQCSFAIIQNRELRKKYLAARKGLVPWVNLMGLAAAQAAYSDGQEWLDQLLIYLQGNREFLYDYIQSSLPGIRMVKPEATYLAWLDCTQAKIMGSPYEFFLERARVALNDGKTFGNGGEGYVRLNFACPRSTLSEALFRMKEALAEV
jgi:cystathionine beta-lyase